MHKTQNQIEAWDYNSQHYDSKSDLYLAILKVQPMEQFGIIDLVDLGVALDFTFPSIDKPFTILGFSSKTSYVSKYGSKILPQKMPTRLPTHINTKTGKVVYTRTLGRFVGRVAGPTGWSVLGYDAIKLFINTQRIYNSIVR
jgi:hypothetical protein